ncbi:hypothetical protein [Desulfosporosinus youngiae]|uniref:Uncharacterized protein n=1 Tax=Desulfosporosinus youngiae DSM 17734 TaxID=768710 RepID=H5Y2P1_9FIRM|nr:hypothetical protein [Desulfosporosinus youngiae]EHQ88304.1 hypothetical protein DesyoDRAFT_1134 [Desulfosporosinus youngiae DSM 17734]
MREIIYRKSDLTCVGTVTEGMTIEQEIELNVIPNYGGSFENYDFIETDVKYFDLELIDEKVTVVASKAPDPLPPEPTYEDYLLDLDFRLSMVELGL